MSTVNDVGLLKAELRMPRTGTWHADIEAEIEADFSNGVTFEIDGVEFVGTALPGRYGPNGTRQIARVVGGKGGLSKTLPANSYEAGAGVKVRAIVEDILRACGEALSPTSDAAILEKRVSRWHLVEGPASWALVKLVVDELGADWRVLADGTVWIGAVAWPEVEIEHVLEDEDWTNGVLSLAPDAPNLTPGVTFLGQKIESVVHVVDNEGLLRTDAHITSTRSAFARMMGRIRQDIDYSRLYRCRVSLQNPDGTLQLVPDEPRVKGRGLDKVPIRLGLPGFRVKVQQGARVMLGFNGGDPNDPFAAFWDTDDADHLTQVVMTKNGREAPISGVGDSVLVILPFTPMASSPTPLPVTAIIQTGNPAYTR